MKKSIILLLTGVSLGVMGFKIQERIQNKPVKIYQKGKSKIVVWENKGADDKTWKNYQVEKEYYKNDEVKYSNSFNEKRTFGFKRNS